LKPAKESTFIRPVFSADDPTIAEDPDDGNPFADDAQIAVDRRSMGGEEEGGEEEGGGQHEHGNLGAISRSISEHPVRERKSSYNDLVASDAEFHARCSALAAAARVGDPELADGGEHGARVYFRGVEVDIIVARGLGLGLFPVRLSHVV
jgi:hypothetical protein